MRSDISKFIKGVDTKKRILEIGPLDTPIFKKSEADVYYADVRSDVELLEVYKNEPRVLDAVPIDFVIEEGYAAALKDVPKFDYVVSCHVLEHMPRLIEFFLDIQKIMTDGAYFGPCSPTIVTALTISDSPHRSPKHGTSTPQRCPTPPGESWITFWIQQNATTPLNFGKMTTWL